MDDPKELHRNWLNWVTANLGRDAALAEIAATAATNAAELGYGYNNAEKAARTAWADAASRYSNRGFVPPAKGHLRRDLAVGCLVCLFLLGVAGWIVLSLASAMYGCYAVMC